jgi:pSer/pThr/pTyr-binding forkhead associated (FHA) protein
VYVEVNGTRHPLAPPGLVVGRGSDADLRINDPGVSRRHAQIRVQTGAQGPVVSIVDLGSTNGLQVDGRRSTEAGLRDGSRVRIGNTDLVVRFSGTGSGTGREAGGGVRG